MSQATEAAVSSTTDAEDSDEWLNTDAEYFEDVLEKKMGTHKATQKDSEAAPMVIDEVQEPSEDRVANEQASKLRKLADKVEEFIDGEGDLEGARFMESVFYLHL